MYEKKESSMPQKLTLLFLETMILCISGWILFFIDSPDARNILLFSLFVIVYLRMCITVFYLLKRKMPWTEALTIPLAFSLYYIGFSLFTITTEQTLTLLDLIYLLLFLFGSYLNTFSELQRDKWKKNSRNKGQLYTKGLFKYSMHINYFGDIVWVTALALLTRTIGALAIPTLLLLLFLLVNIPMLDAYLSKKYGEQFKAYQQKTKKLIPFIY